MERTHDRLEVTVSWGSSPLATELFTDANVVIGETDDAAFTLPTELLEMPFTLATRSDEGWLVRIPAAAIARASKRVGDSEESVDLSGLTCDGLGTRALAMSEGMRLEIAIGEFSFCLRLAGEIERIATTTPFDWKLLRWFGASALFHAAVVLVLLLQPPQAGALSVDVDRSALEFIQVTLDAYSSEPVEMPASNEGPAGAASSEGRPMEGAPGAAGRPDERQNDGGNVRVRGNDTERRIPLTARDVHALRTLAGLELAAASITNIDSPYGAQDAAGWDVEDAYGPLGPDGIGPGRSGFDMIGDGRGTCPVGATNCGDGTIGVGNFDTIGTRGGCSQGDFNRFVQLYGRAGAMDRCSGTSTTVTDGTIDRTGGGVPTVRPAGDAVTVGGLSKEEIRRVVRRNLAQVRFCYSQELQSNPDLDGRVSVQFHIAPSGAVQSAEIASSSVGNVAMEQCVASAVRRWGFPQSPGLTVATYPFLFQHP